MKKDIHSWLKSLNIYFHPGSHSELLDHAAEDTLNSLLRLGHTVQEQANDQTDVVLTTHQFGDVLGWRKSLMFTSRIKFKLAHTPRTITLTQITTGDFERMIAHFSAALAREPHVRSDFEFEGFGPYSTRCADRAGTARWTDFVVDPFDPGAAQMHSCAVI